ncbi:hypothetical protein N2152v2_004557 [Parachlorella kessleri]
MARPLVLLLLLLLALKGQAWVPPWERDSTKVAKDSAWEYTLEVLWNNTKDKVGFCLGASQRNVLQLIGESFQWPLPTGPADDALCSNGTKIDAHLCGPLELDAYYKYMLMTTNPEKIPDTAQCAAGAASTACGPGFFDATIRNRPGPVAEEEPHACCEGYFCPSMLTCMIPCPLGAYCPRAWPALPPDGYKTRGDDSSSWCAPYAYKERKPAGCGGADRWSVLMCTEGHFCRQGGTEPDRCPPGVHCPLGTDIPENGTTGITVDALLFVGLWLLYAASRWYNRVLQKLGTRERLRITWGRQPEITVVAAAAPAQPPPSPLSPASAAAAAALAGAAGSVPEGVLSGGEEDGVLSGEEEVFSGDEESGPRRGSSPLALLRSLSPRRSPKRRPKEATGPVWAAFSAPEGDAYEALPDEPQQELVPTRSRRTRSRGHRRSSSGSEFTLDASTPRSLHRQLLAQQRQPLLSNHMASMLLHGAGSGAAGSGGAQRAKHRPLLGVEFRDLGLRLRSCGKVVLAGVTGQLRAARTTAIMGPSGAGACVRKTTLLNTLSGKASYGVRTGDILVNGRPDRLERYKPVMGFVPQDDIMCAQLSVEENLYFAARYRLPARYKREQHLYFVERAIQILQLEDVRHELIGNEETRGISGGQRKRVNVGLELVADPLLLFLDEPTSGLDSTASKALVAALQAVARGGVTAAAVIHQPSYEIFDMFDDLMMLGKGGRTVYYGPQAGVQAYFEGLGFELPSRMNPADVYMDIISGSIVKPGQQEPDVAALFDAWDEHCGRHKWQLAAAAAPGDAPASEAAAGEGAPLLGDVATPRTWRARAVKAKEVLLLGAAYLVSSARDMWEAGVDLCRQLDGSLLGGRLLGGSKQPEGEGSYEDARDVRRLARRATPGFLPQYYWCLSRAILKRVREPLMVFTDYAIVALTGMTLGLISDRGRSTIMHFAVSVTYSTIALGMISKVGALPTFGRDRVVFFREAASGLNRFSYFLALDTFDHAGTLLRSAVYLIMWYSFAVPRAIIWQMYLVTVAIIYCCSGTAYFLSQVLEPSAAQMAAAVLTLICTLIARESDPHGLLNFIKQTSFARWGLEGYVIAESNRLTGVWLLARCADLEGLGYDVRRFGFCLLALFGLGMIYRVAALAAMLLLHRDKQR